MSTASQHVVEVEPLKMARVSHGFFMRSGGSSTGIYESNNCAFGSSDTEDAVARNRESCARHLGATALVTVKQRHTNEAVAVDAPWTWQNAPVADALVTQRPGIAIGILTADCAPVLLADPTAGIIAAAHAGWRGAFDGVIANTVTKMEAMGAQRSRITAAVGPCIAQASYEVGPEFVARFVERDPAHERFFSTPKADGHAQFDLPAFVAHCLTAAGVGKIVIEGSDTCAGETRFFSYRRSVLRGEKDYGRQLSAIALKGAP